MLLIGGSIPAMANVLKFFEAHQGVMTDRRHFLKRGDRPTKKERQTTASGLGKSDKLRFVLWVKSDSDMYYNKTSDKAATKLVTSDLGYTLGGPHFFLYDFS